MKKNQLLKNFNNLSAFNRDNIKKIKDLINKNYNFKIPITPILTTHYKRGYFISSNKLVRATIDTDLQSVLIKENRDINIKKNYKDIILEIKYDTDLDEHVRNNLKKITARLSKNSKFANSALITPSSFSWYDQ